MRTLSFVVAGLAILIAALLPESDAHAYADRRTHRFGEPNRVVHRYEVENAYELQGAKATFHCVYFAASGKCQAVARSYSNVRSPRVTGFRTVLDVSPSAVSPKAPARSPIFIRPISNEFRYEEYLPATYDDHYRRVHRFDDGVRYDY